MSGRAHFSGSGGVVSVFVIEIDGRPILAFEAGDLAEAVRVASDADLMTDLMALTSSGRSICSLNSTINVRLALQAELEVFEHAVQVAPACDQPTMTFLIKIDGVIVVAVEPE